MARLQFKINGNSSHWGKLVVVLPGSWWMVDWIAERGMMLQRIGKELVFNSHRIVKSINWVQCRGMVGTLKQDGDTPKYSLKTIKSAIKRDLWQLTDPLHEGAHPPTMPGQKAVQIELYFRKKNRRTMPYYGKRRVFEWYSN